MSNYKSNSNVEHCFKLLMYLHEYGITKCCEFSKMFNVSDKQIRRYVYALRASGINIVSKGGKNGGYYLDSNECPLCKKEWK